MLTCHFAIFGVTMVPCHAEKARHKKATGEESTKLLFPTTAEFSRATDRRAGAT
jgi:hypothetical protein